MFNAVHEALSHKGRFALEYVQVLTPNCPVRFHRFIVGVAVVENGNVVHKMVHSKDMDFWMEHGAQSGITMTFPSTLPQDQLDAWKQQCDKNHVQYSVGACEYSEMERRCHQAIVERSAVTVCKSKKRFAA